LRLPHQGNRVDAERRAQRDEPRYIH
jgi:hypothetical protein